MVYNDFAPEEEIQYTVSPTTGTAWETEFQVDLAIESQFAYDCRFFYEYLDNRYEMIPQGITPAEAAILRDHRSYTSMPISIGGIKLPADETYADKKLRTFASCYIPG